MPPACPIRSFFLALWLALACSAGLAQAATLYAYPSGGTNCTPGAASYAGIQAAIDAATNGDTVMLCPGSYTGGANLKGRTYFTLRSTPGNPTVE